MAPKRPFSLATPQLHEDLDQTGNRIQTTPWIPSFWQGVICHFWVSQFKGHREQTRGVRLCQSATPHSVKAAVSLQIRYFLKGGGMNQKKENAMLLPFSRGSKGYPSFGPVSLHL